MKINDRISVVCPSYNSAQFIIRTLESVLLQTEKPFEFIISDDGSTDNTRETVVDFIARHDDFPITFIQNAHCGPGAARNSGILHAKGDWIAFIDSDDTWQPDKLANIKKIIHKHGEYNFICHSVKHIKLDGSSVILDNFKYYNDKTPLLPQLYLRNFFSTSAVVCSRKMLIDTGLFDEKLMSAQDYELWLRLSSELRPYFIQKVLGCYYERVGSITSKKYLRKLLNSYKISFKYRKHVKKRYFFLKCARLPASTFKKVILKALYLLSRYKNNRNFLREAR